MSASAKETHNYEGMFLLHSGKFASDSDGVVNELMDILKKCDAEVVAHRPWQDGKLAYEIDGHRKGLHYLVMFKMPPRNNPQLTRLSQLSDIIIRQLIIAHPQVLFDANVDAINQGNAVPVGSTAAAQDEI